MGSLQTTTHLVFPCDTGDTARPSHLQSLPDEWVVPSPLSRLPHNPCHRLKGWGSPHGLEALGWSSWTTFFFPPLEVTTPSQAASSLQQAPPGKERATGPFCSPQFWDGGAEARQHMKHFPISPSMVPSGHSSLPNRTVWVSYRVLPGSTHFMGLKRACP